MSELIILSIILTGISGIISLFFKNNADLADKVFVLIFLTGSLIGLFSILSDILGYSDINMTIYWSLPGGSFSIKNDFISSVFLFPLYLISSMGSIYGLGYYSQKDNGANACRFKILYGIVNASVAIVLLSNNSILFITVWEIMAISSFFLITSNDNSAEVRKSGFIYIVATHTGTLALFALFILISNGTGSFQFPDSGELAFNGGAIFILSIFGFGIKAGLMPLHVWLPGAHASAPTHASALLSGVVIKTGIYGIIRVVSFFEYVPPWWGWTLLILGSVSGILGVAYAIAQHDIKRLLAYHSVENIGIILLGVGLALLGRSFSIPALVVFGLSGALLHVINHGLFKSLLFFSAGSVIHATGSRRIDSYGGMIKVQPFTALYFLIGAVAISGLPPFNGFISEFLIYLASFASVGGNNLTIRLSVLVAPVLAIIGGLALACFVKVFGVTFLGEARSEETKNAKSNRLTMSFSMMPLALASIFIGIFPWMLNNFLLSSVDNWCYKIDVAAFKTSLNPLFYIGTTGVVLLLFSSAVFIFVWYRSRNIVKQYGTWGCGYLHITNRMQYTASSFGDMLVSLFKFGVRVKKEGGEIKEIFPHQRMFHTYTFDIFLDNTIFPLFKFVEDKFIWIRRKFQNGVISFYLIYVMATIIFLLFIIL